ncbi:hypothetical protein [Robertmurraya sp. 2P01SA]|uniref:hypothetical protein n=1 Tax=Robertmurraya TaxID=2837507 RepID=UPI0039A6B838
MVDLDGTLLDRDTSLKNFIEDQYERLSKLLGHVPKEQQTAEIISKIVGIPMVEMTEIIERDFGDD